MKRILTSALLAMYALVCTAALPAAVRQELNRGWTFRQAGSGEWQPASVPGCNHTDLIAIGKLPYPFYRLNELEFQWTDKVDWEYRTEFTAGKSMLGGDRVVLKFHGLDTYADVYLNGEHLLSADNMFREYEIQVKGKLRPKANELLVRFRSPIVEGIHRSDAYPLQLPISDNDMAALGQVEGNRQVSVFTRKAGYHFGWDWGPRLVSCGIWRPVELIAWNKANTRDLHIIRRGADSLRADFTADVEIEAAEAAPARIEIRCDDRTVAAKEVTLSPGKARYPIDFTIRNPKLWWTNGLGGQPLYDISARVETQKIRSEISRRIGVRTVEFVREKDSAGTSFYFRLNGVPVFIKGANYIPSDIYPARVSAERYGDVINTARESNFNMLRVWGGGYYEDDRFYDLCDEAGILVWQDFMFACSMFPADEAMLGSIRREAEDNVRRLRNHPCIALWCGNNEILSAWKHKGTRIAKKDSVMAARIWREYEKIFHETLPEVVSRLDPEHAYWSSSPSAGEGVFTDFNTGDGHYWDVWWGKKPFSTYATAISRFMSEYGFQSFPDLSTVESYALPEDYDIDSEVMRSHQRSSIGNQTITHYMEQDYRQPKDFESFLYLSQVLQAEGVKYALEGHRRTRPFCMGSLYWQINDCWPVASWSSTDYLGRWKALQYFVQKSFAPLCVSPYISGDKVMISTINDNLSSVKCTLRVSVIDFRGDTVFSRDIPVEALANAVTPCFEMPRTELLQGVDPAMVLLHVQLLAGGESLAENTLYFVPVRQLELPVPDIRVTVKKGKKGIEITLHTDKLAKNVYLLDSSLEGRFSDNCFDLLPGHDRTIAYQGILTDSELIKQLKIRTIADTY